LFDADGATDRRTERNDEFIDMHDDLLHMSLLGSDPGISHVIHSLMRRDDKRREEKRREEKRREKN
jgi:hypothetical protein